MATRKTLAGAIGVLLSLPAASHAGKVKVWHCFIPTWDRAGKA